MMEPAVDLRYAPHPEMASRHTKNNIDADVYWNSVSSDCSFQLTGKTPDASTEDGVQRSSAQGLCGPRTVPGYVPLAFAMRHVTNSNQCIEGRRKDLSSLPVCGRTANDLAPTEVSKVSSRFSFTSTPALFPRRSRGVSILKSCHASMSSLSTAVSDAHHDEVLCGYEDGSPIRYDNVTVLAQRIYDTSNDYSTSAPITQQSGNNHRMAEEHIMRSTIPPVTVVFAVAQRFMALATASPLNPREMEDPSCYHAISVPSINIHAYLKRFQVMCHITDESLVLGLIYAERVLKIVPTVTINLLTVHRLCLACTVLAAKFFEDIFYANSCYARCGGVTLKELNALEQSTLHYLDFRLFVQPELFERYLELCVASCET